MVSLFSKADEIPPEKGKPKLQGYSRQEWRRRGSMNDTGAGYSCPSYGAYNHTLEGNCKTNNTNQHNTGSIKKIISKSFTEAEEYVLANSAPFVSRTPLSTKLLVLGIMFLFMAALFLGISLYTAQYSAHLDDIEPEQDELSLPIVTQELLVPAGPHAYDVISPPASDPQIFEPNLDGAIATMRYFYNARDYALATGDTSYMESVSHSVCVACKEMVNEAKTLHTGKNIVQSGTSSNFSNQVVENPDKSVLITSVFQWDGYQVNSPKGKLIAHVDPGSVKYTWVLKLVKDRYMVMAMLDDADKS